MNKWAKTYLNTAETSEYLGVPSETLKMWRSRGRGPKYRKLPNGKVSYRLDWLDEFNEQHVVTPSEFAAA
jgi:hypothetical protein